MARMLSSSSFLLDTFPLLFPPPPTGIESSTRPEIRSLAKSNVVSTSPTWRRTSFTKSSTLPSPGQRSSTCTEEVFLAWVTASCEFLSGIRLKPHALFLLTLSHPLLATFSPSDPRLVMLLSRTLTSLELQLIPELGKFPSSPAPLWRYWLSLSISVGSVPIVLAGARLASTQILQDYGLPIPQSWEVSAAELATADWKTDSNGLILLALLIALIVAIVTYIRN